MNITIRNCEANNNYGHGVQAWINSGDARNISILVENVHVRGGPGCWHAANPPGTEWSSKAGGFVFGRVHPPGGSLVIRDSTCRDTPLYGIYVWDLYGSGMRVTFSNVTLINTANQPELLSPYSNQAAFSALPNAPVGLDYLGEVESGLALYDVVVHDALRRAWMQVNSHWAPGAIVGNVRVIKKVIQPMPSCWVNSSAPLTNLSVECDIVATDRIPPLRGLLAPRRAPTSSITGRSGPPWGG